jgi:hypothetical protein
VVHDIATRDRQEAVNTEELRQAMVHYRALFADLLHDGGMLPVRDVRMADHELLNSSWFFPKPGANQKRRTLKNFIG